MHHQPNPPPPEISHIVALIGEVATLALVEHFGGSDKMHIPHCPAGSTLEATVGTVAAQLLSERYGGDKMRVPLAKHWRVRAYVAQGLSHAEIARRLQCNQSSIRRALNPGMVEHVKRQMSLF